MKVLFPKIAKKMKKRTSRPEKFPARRIFGLRFGRGKKWTVTAMEMLVRGALQPRCYTSEMT